MGAAPERAIAIAITAVSKQFGPNQALDGASLEVRAGEVLGLLGPNGAGKTTLVRCTMGRARPDAGTIAVLGEPAGSVTARAALGWVPQDLAIYPRLSVRENLAVFGRYHGLSGRALRKAS